jgi:hypothetical protein
VSIAAPAHVGRGQAGRGGDGVEHHALERALAQLADEQADEKVLLGGGGTGEQRLQRRAARGGRALAGGGGDLGEGGVDLAQRQRGRAAAAPRSVDRVDQPTPIRPWRISPESQATAISTSSGAAPRNTRRSRRAWRGGSRSRPRPRTRRRGSRGASVMAPFSTSRRLREPAGLVPLHPTRFSQVAPARARP